MRETSPQIVAIKSLPAHFGYVAQNYDLDIPIHQPHLK